MKKILSIMLALILVLSMATVAFAEEIGGELVPTGQWNGTYTATEETTFNEIVKTYTSENNVVVNETLSFTSSPKSDNPDTTKNLRVANLDVSSLTPGTLAVTIPSLDKAGVYEWTITENAGNTAGVTYSTAEVHVIALVEYNNEKHCLQVAETTSYIRKIDGTKAKTFENTFKSGSFTVSKEVTGNMANQKDEFEITVTLTSAKPIGTNISVAGTTVAPNAWTNNNGTYTCAYTTNYSQIGGAKAFADIPEGVTVSIVENAGKMNGYTYISTNENETNNFSMTVADADDNKAVVVTNNKTTEVDMGVTLDSLPYILMLVVVCGAMFVLFTKKRAAREN